MGKQRNVKKGEKMGKNGLVQLHLCSFFFAFSICFLFPFVLLLFCFFFAFCLEKSKIKAKKKQTKSKSKKQKKKANGQVHFFPFFAHFFPFLSFLFSFFSSWRASTTVATCPLEKDCDCDMLWLKDMVADKLAASHEKVSHRVPSASKWAASGRLVGSLSRNLATSSINAGE